MATRDRSLKNLQARKVPLQFAFTVQAFFYEGQSCLPKELATLNAVFYKKLN